MAVYNDPVMERIILKYLNKDLTKAEEYQLREWLEKDETNRKVFENIVADWTLKIQDIEKSQKRIYQKVTNTPKDQHKSKSSSFYLLRVAAVFVLVFTATLLLFHINRSNVVETKGLVKIERQTLPGQKLTLKLLDGTLVTLNAASKLITPESFNGSVRKVFLEGEAFFDVARDVSKPFIIETNAANIEVLGTSFNIRSYPDDKNMLVAVNSGKVMVTDKNQTNEHFLLKNEMLIYSSEKKSFSKTVGFDRDQVFGWKEKILVFKEESIENIFKRLSRLYNVRFKILSTIDQEKRFTAKFNNQTFEAIIKSISFVYQFEYEIHENEVIIK